LLPKIAPIFLLNAFADADSNASIEAVTVDGMAAGVLVVVVVAAAIPPVDAGEAFDACFRIFCSIGFGDIVG
jgi:hypothetical protein